VVQDRIRRLTTTVTDLEESVRRLTASAVEAGRPAGAPSRSVLIGTIEFCSDKEVGEHEQRLRKARQAPGADVDQCPYVLIGSASRMREKLAERQTRLGLSAVIVPDSDALAPFMTEVVRLMPGSS